MLKSKHLILREIEVLKYLNKGYFNTEISLLLFSALPKLKSNLKNLFIKVKITNRVESKKHHC